MFGRLHLGSLADIAQTLFPKAKRLDKGQGLLGLCRTNYLARTSRKYSIQGHVNNIYKSEHHLSGRCLRLREAGSIQEFIFCEKKYMTSYKHIGNVVPPLLSYIFADQVGILGI